MHSYLLVCSLMGAYATTTPAGPQYAQAIHERRHGPTGLQRGQRVENHSITTFRVSLKQSNLEHGYAYLMNVSDPHSDGYGDLWPPERVHTTFAPSRTSVETVHDWLVSSGIRTVQEGKGWLSFETTVGHAEALLHASYYEHVAEDGVVRVGCDR